MTLNVVLSLVGTDHVSPQIPKENRREAGSVCSLGCSAATSAVEDEAEDFAAFQVGRFGASGRAIHFHPLPITAGLLCYVSSGNSFHYLPSQLN